jgi:hypothetical protein
MDKINVDILQDFCNPESNNEWYNEPFVNDGHVVATDAHALISIKQEMVYSAKYIETCDKKYLEYVQTQEASATDSLILNVNTLIEALKKLPSDQEETHICQDCKGRGTVEFDYYAHNDQVYNIVAECPVCHGIGIDDSYEYLKMLHVWVSKTQCAINIKDIWFNPKYIENVVYVMKKLDFVQCKMKYSSNRELCVFELNDDIKIYVMPIFHSDDIENIAEVKPDDGNSKDGNGLVLCIE